jgi:diacylglycerol kinase
MKALYKSVTCACRGLRVVATERNFVIQMFAAIFVAIFIVVLRTSYIENAILMICVGLVLGGEVMNSALERLSDFVSPSHHQQIGIIKDMMASGVLIFSLTALMVGVIIFGNRIILLW